MILFVLLICTVGGTPLGRPWTSSDCQEPVKPPGYQFENASYVAISKELLDSMKANCQKVNGVYPESTRVQCLNNMAQAENALVNLYWASDIDLTNIYRSLFGCNGYAGVALFTTLINDHNQLSGYNSTVFGSQSDPGLLNDIRSLLDGLQAIKTVAEGQLKSIQAASAQQVVVAKSLQGNVIDSVNRIMDDTMRVMQSLVGNRTRAQNQVFVNIDGKVTQAVKDISNQANAIHQSFATTYGQLTERFSQWKAASDDAIVDVTERGRQLKDAGRQADQAALKLTADLNSLELANVATQVDKASTDFTNDISNARDGISSDIASLGNDLANSVLANRARFSAQATALVKKVLDQSDSIRSNVAASSSFRDASSQDTIKRAEAGVQKFRELLVTRIKPLVEDVQKAMKNAVGLTAVIEAVKKQTSTDIVKLKSIGTQKASEIGSRVSTQMTAMQLDFVNKFQKVDGTMQSQIADRVKSGRQQLDAILNGAQLIQGNTGTEQIMLSQTNRDQAAASMTAASLVGAKQQLAADNARAGLNSIVNVVGNALEDSQQTIQDITKSNLANVVSMNQQVSASQLALMQKAYNKVTSSDQDAMNRNTAIQGDSFDAQLSGQSLEQSISQSGAQLDASVSFQNRKAQSLLDDINQLVNIAKQDGGSLQSQMAAFEQQAPSLYAMLQQKIAAYKALVISQGQQTQLAAATSAGDQARTALTDLSTHLQDFATSSIGISPALQSAENSVSMDSSTLIRNMKAFSDKLSAQSNNGASLINSKAQLSMADAAAMIRSSSSDSAAALAALMKYAADMAAQRRTAVLMTGDAAYKAAYDASTQLTDDARNFIDLSQQFVLDATHLGDQVSQNLSSMVGTINRTLSDVTGSANSYLARLSEASGNMTNWPTQIVSRAAAINAAIQAKAANVTKVIVSIASSSTNGTADIQQGIVSLRSFIDELVEAFNHQRSVFREFSKTFTVRRFQLISQLNETLEAQRVQFLNGIASADLVDSQRSNNASDAVRNLMASLEKAKDEGTTDMSEVRKLMDRMNNGVGDLTKSFESQMGGNIESLKQEAIKNSLLSQQGLGRHVGETRSSAKLLAGKLADALDQISGSSIAGEAAASEASKDVYAIAGMLRNVGQETQKKISSLLKALQSGDTTFAVALGAAKNMTKRDISTVMDVLSVFDRNIASHVAKIYAFNASVAGATSALNKTAIRSIGQHVQVNAQSLARMTVSQFQLVNMSEAYLSNRAKNYTGIIERLQSIRNQSIHNVEAYMNSILNGVAQASFIQRQQGSGALVLPNVTKAIPDILNDARTNYSIAVTRVATAKSVMDGLVSASIAKANKAVIDILNITKTALRAR